MEIDLREVADAIKKVEMEIQDVGTNLKKLETEISDAKMANDKEELTYLRDEKNKLLDKENKLLDEKKQLRDEKNKLLGQRNAMNQAPGRYVGLQPGCIMDMGSCGLYKCLMNE